MQLIFKILCPQYLKKKRLKFKVFISSSNKYAKVDLEKSIKKSKNIYLA